MCAPRPPGIVCYVSCRHALSSLRTHRRVIALSSAECGRPSSASFIKRNDSVLRRLIGGRNRRGLACGNMARISRYSVSGWQKHPYTSLHLSINNMLNEYSYHRPESTRQFNIKKLSTIIDKLEKLAKRRSACASTLSTCTSTSLCRDCF